MSAWRGWLVGVLWLPSMASAHDWQVLEVGGGRRGPAAQHAPLDDAQSAGWMQEVEATVKRLGLDATPRAKRAGTLAHPLLQTAGIASSTRIGISNFVDLDATFPDRLRDYECRQRSYDTATGYNHGGIDYFIWPFGWQGMAQENVAVVAAAAGTIVRHVDGNTDRNCSMTTSTAANAIHVLHDDGTVGVYLHFKRGSLTAKRVGDRVELGEFLGWIGSSGSSTAPHLHFELRSSATANAAVIDPNQGQCNAQPSRWATQPAYREPRVEMLGVHSAAPQFYFESCSSNEAPNFARRFAPGQTIHLTAYYADQPPGLVSTFVVRDPSGNELSRFTHAPAAGPLEGADAYNASYWFFQIPIPISAAHGMYTAEVQYEGTVRRQRFAVGGPVYDASGIWYDPTQSGHGMVTEVIDSGGSARLAAAWFVYLDGQPRWLSGVGDIVGNSSTVPMLISTGGQFPPSYRREDVQFESWGELVFTFHATDNGRVEWRSSYPGFSSGSMPLTRFARLADINLDDEHSGMRACLSGTWYAPSQSGHGVQLQVVNIGAQRTLIATWYVYRDGRQLWLTGAAPIGGKSVTVPLSQTRGGRFPPQFVSSEVVSEPWGSATFDVIDPQRLRLSWQGSESGAVPGALELVRLTETLSSACL